MLAVLFLQTGGIVLVFKVQQSFVHAEMQKKVCHMDSGMQKIVLDLKDYLSCDVGSAEIMWQGRLYDIQSVKISGNKAEVFAFYDVREENILDRISDYFHSTNQSNIDIASQLHQLSLLDYLFPETCTELNVPYSVFAKMQSPVLNPESNKLDPLTPPPQSI